MRKLITAALLSLPILSACASGGGTPAMSPTVSPLYTSRYCQGLDRAAAVNLLSAEQWSAFLGKQQDKAQLSSAADGQVVMINMGEKRTAGYGIRLASTAAQVEDGVLHLSVIWETPQPGMMQAQMITHPCLAVSVAGQFHTVQVVDQSGRVRLATSSR
jgi:hypothetical protein